MKMQKSQRLKVDICKSHRRVKDNTIMRGVKRKEQQGNLKRSEEMTKVMGGCQKNYKDREG